MKRENLIEVLTVIFKAYLFIYLNFNFNVNSCTINLLPTWLGYYWLGRSIKVLKDRQKTLGLIEPLCDGLIVYYGIVWCLNILGISFDVDVLNLLVNIIGLYFHFQFLTDLAEVMKPYRCSNTQKLLQLRTVRTILLTIPALPLQWEQMEWAALILMGIYLIVTVMTCSTLHALKNELSEIDVFENECEPS